MEIEQSGPNTFTVTGVQPNLSSYTYPSMGLREVRDYTQVLMGKVKTIIDAAVADPRQNKATKDLAHQAVWGLYDEVRKWADQQQFGISGSLHSAFPFGSGEVPVSI